MGEKDPLRILIVDGKLICGGVESFLMNLYRHIDRSKVQFDFLVHYKEKFYYDDEIEALGGKIYRLTFRNDKNYFKYKKDLKNFFTTHSEYKIIWGHMDGLASIYLKIAKECGIKRIICHSHITNAEYSLKGIIKRILRRNVWKYCDYKFACSTEAGKYLYGNHKFQLINNAIEIEKFLFNKEIRNKIRKQHNWENKIVIGHIGRFSKQKNHLFVIKIFEKLFNIDKNYVLCLCGDGENRNRIEKFIENKVYNKQIYFTGNISNVNEYYQAFDIFIMPSLYEGLPVTGVEAQASGLKCIFADTITHEINLVADNVEFLSINEENIDNWVVSILKKKNYHRKDCTDIIYNKGYSISNLAEKIMLFMEKIRYE